MVGGGRFAVVVTDSALGRTKRCVVCHREHSINLVCLCSKRMFVQRGMLQRTAVRTKYRPFSRNMNPRALSVIFPGLPATQCIFKVLRMAICFDEAFLLRTVKKGGFIVRRWKASYHQSIASTSSSLMPCSINTAVASARQILEAKAFWTGMSQFWFSLPGSQQCRGAGYCNASNC